MSVATISKTTKMAIPKMPHHVTTPADADGWTFSIHVEASKTVLTKEKAAASYSKTELPSAGRVAEANVAKPITAGAPIIDQRGRGWKPGARYWP
jgi:hypothetical protein